MQRNIIASLLFCMIVSALLYACGSGSGSAGVGQDSTAASDSTAIAPTSPAPSPLSHNDTSTPQTQPTTEPKTGVLGYSYFKKMRRKDTRFIHAFISINHPESKVWDTLRQLNKEDQIENGKDTSTIITKADIRLYSYVKITIINLDSAFHIQAFQDTAKQKIDMVSGNHWEWAVTAETNQPQGILVLKIEAETPSGGTVNLGTRSIPISIEIERTLPRKIWNYMNDNPGWVLAAILIPLISFFGKRYFDRKRQKNNSDA